MAASIDETIRASRGAFLGRGTSMPSLPVDACGPCSCASLTATSEGAFWASRGAAFLCEVFMRSSLLDTGWPWSCADPTKAPLGRCGMAAAVAACISRSLAGTSAREGSARNTAKSKSASALVPRHGAFKVAPLPMLISARQEDPLPFGHTAPSSEIGFCLGIGWMCHSPQAGLWS